MKGIAAGTAKSVLGGMKICAWCLGRQYASSQSEIEKTGWRVAKQLALRPSGRCELCGNAYKKRSEIEDLVVKKLRQIEFSTFQVGVVLPSDSVDREDEMRSRLRLSSGISLKKGLTTMFRRDLAERLHRVPSLRNPEVTIRIGLPEESVSVECKPITIYTEYLKLRRGVPVRAVTCSSCHGKGCEVCEGTGLEKDAESVEAALAAAFVDAFKGERVRISWSGIEEDSSLLLGSGRPTYIEVTAPARRKSGLFLLNMAPTRHVQITRAELATLDRSNIEDLVKEVLVTADFESELKVADVRLLEQAYKDRDVSTFGDKRPRPKRVHGLTVLDSRRKARILLVLDNRISLRQLLSIKADAEGQQGVRPTFADLLPMNRVLAAESDVVGFHRAGYSGKALIMGEREACCKNRP